VGEDPASKVYVAQKQKVAQEIGLMALERILPADASEAEILKVVKELNEDSSVHGILCQVPLPKGLNENKILEAIAPEKDVDGIHPFNQGLLTLGRPRFIPCTAHACLQVLKHYHIPTEGKKIVVVGRSPTVGRPASILLSGKGFDATVTLVHSKTPHIEEVCREADILLVAIGKGEFIKKNFVKKEAIILDVGINQMPDGRLVGDVDFNSVSDQVDMITPVPGGIGPITIALLMENTVKAAKAAKAVKK
jgi:methylenetetrahydrofolate dehydrogenase (NADP+)/methenyltetrahydrofolate cyclohydrolase